MAASVAGPNSYGGYGGYRGGYGGGHGGGYGGYGGYRGGYGGGYGGYGGNYYGWQTTTAEKFWMGSWSWWTNMLESAVNGNGSLDIEKLCWKSEAIVVNNHFVTSL